MIIDFHTHAFPDGLAERAMAQLTPAAGDAFRPHHDGTLGGLLRLMDAAGVDRAVVASIATKPAHAGPILDWSLRIASERIIPFASVHPDDGEAVRRVEAIAAAGLAGIKLHPFYQRFTVDEARLDPIYDAARANGLIVLLHAGYDIAFPRDPLATPAATARVVARHPGLKLVAAHLGGWMDWERARADLVGRPCWLDLSSSLEFLTPAAARDLIERHGARRVLFATDAPWSDPARTLARLRALELDPRQEEWILSANARELLGEDAREAQAAPPTPNQVPSS